MDRKMHDEKLHTFYHTANIIVL